MRIHSLEHEPFEGPANIEIWAKNKGHRATSKKRSVLGFLAYISALSKRSVATAMRDSIKMMA